MSEVEIIIKRAIGEDISFKSDKLHINAFHGSVEKVNSQTNEVEKTPIGESILLITGNMPDGLQNQINKTIREYIGI